MPPNRPHPLSAHPRKTPAGQAASDCASAEATLDPGHPLIAILRRFATVKEQLLTLAWLQVAGLIVLWKGPIVVPLALACGAVQIALALRLVCLESQTRALCRQLIMEGREQLPLRSVSRELRRLRDGRHRVDLARSIAGLANEASRPLRGRRHPIYRPTVVRAVAAQLHEIAVLMQDSDAPARGVAHVEWLITAGGSPLYGTDVGPLREELARTRYFLAARR